MRRHNIRRMAAIHLHPPKAPNEPTLLNPERTQRRTVRPSNNQRRPFTVHLCTEHHRPKLHFFRLVLRGSYTCRCWPYYMGASRSPSSIDYLIYNALRWQPQGQALYGVPGKLAGSDNLGRQRTTKQRISSQRSIQGGVRANGPSQETAEPGEAVPMLNLVSPPNANKKKHMVSQGRLARCPTIRSLLPLSLPPPPREVVAWPLSCLAPRGSARPEQSCRNVSGIEDARRRGENNTVQAGSHTRVRWWWHNSGGGTAFFRVVAGARDNGTRRRPREGDNKGFSVACIASKVQVPLSSKFSTLVSIYLPGTRGCTLDLPTGGTTRISVPWTA